MRALLVTHGTRGDVQPFLALAVALRKRGHEVVLTAPESYAQDAVERDVEDALAQRGYRNDQPVFFVWEAVTQYLTEDAVRATFDFLAEAPVGSELVFTFVRKDFLDGTEMFGGEAAYRDFVLKRRMWKFGLLPGEVEEFLAPYGWVEREQLGPREYAERYLEPSGRALPVSEIERAVHCVNATA